MKKNSRRAFIKKSILGISGAGLIIGNGSSLFARPSLDEHSKFKGKPDFPQFKVKTLTHGPKHHFFGYYGVPPWNQSGKYMVCLESNFQDHLPASDEYALIGRVDPETGEFTAVGKTYAWNLQQGSLLHWNPLNPETEIIFNNRKQGRLVSTILDVETGDKRYLSRPISAVSRKSGHALSLTYGRLSRLRKVVGYGGAEDPNPHEPHPDNDGVFLMDLVTGKTDLIISIGEVYRYAVKKYPVLKDRHMWFNHTVYNKSDSRFLFLARSWTSDKILDSAMYTVNIDGSDLKQVTPWGGQVSHFDWRNDDEIIATFKLGDDVTKTHYLFNDGMNNYKQVGKGFIVGGGHCTFSPDQNWLTTDRTHSSYFSKALMLYNVKTKQSVLLGVFSLKEKLHLSGDLRCDLHPRWNRTGDAICFDALDTSDWTRQLHVVHLNLPENN